jgi:hypothetical protein
MNLEIGAEAAQFPEKEYINGIAVAVYCTGSKFCEGLHHALWDIKSGLKPVTDIFLEINHIDCHISFLTKLVFKLPIGDYFFLKWTSGGDILPM